MSVRVVGRHRTGVTPAKVDASIAAGRRPSSRRAPGTGRPGSISRLCGKPSPGYTGTTIGHPDRHPLIRLHPDHEPAGRIDAEGIANA